MGLHLIMPEFFWDMYNFLRMYCKQDQDTGKWTWGNNGLSQLEKHLGGHYVARTKKDVGIDLPPQTPIIEELEFDQEAYPLQWRYMQQLNKHAQIALENGKVMGAAAIIALITRKRQMNVFPAGIKIYETDPETKEKMLVMDVGDEVRESMKIDRAIEYIQEVTSDGDKVKGERVVLFSQFNEPLYELEKRLNSMGISAVTMCGPTPQSERERIQLDFDRTTCSEDEFEHQVLLTNYKVGGVGLNLTAATQVVILDEPWNPGTLEQAFDRVNRIGQTQKSTVLIIRLADTIDTWLADLIAQKADLVNNFENRGRELTTSLLEAMNNGSVV
jgi:SNF2 family DNA or RNA helicase